MKLTKILHQWLVSAASFINPQIGLVDGGQHPVLNTITRLDISANKLTQLPLVVFQLPCLKVLSASENSLSTLPSLGPRRKRETAPQNGVPNGKFSNSCDDVGEGDNTEDSDFTYRESSWNCPHLEEIELNRNSFTTLPTCLFQLPSLRYLNMSFNDIDSLPFDMWMAPVLKTLELKGNYLKKLPVIKGRVPNGRRKAATLPRAKVIPAEKPRVFSTR